MQADAASRRGLTQVLGARGMFSGAGGNEIVGTEYASKHSRLALTLAPPAGPEFKVAFTGLAAYLLRSRQLGREILALHKTDIGTLAQADWDRFEAADQSDTWPANLPSGPEGIAQQISSLALTGYKIELAGCEPAWVVSKDFVLLGRKPRT